ncbi:MAG: nitronate monooxygenase [Pseudomonadales bacterium]
MNLLTLLGISLPIIQAPMAGVQGARLAAAVSRAGGLGSIPCAMLSPDGIRREVEDYKGRFEGQAVPPFNLNFFCHAMPEPDADKESAWREALAPYYKELGIDLPGLVTGPGRQPFSDDTMILLEELKPPVVSFHFGLPAGETISRIKDYGATVLSSATTVEEAMYLERQGVDVVIAQGAEAGGHRGLFLSDDIATQMGTFSLLPQVAAAVEVPVIAAGGIAGRDSVTAAFALGAAGVQAGTAYLLCPECDTSKVHREAIAGRAALNTALTNVFTGRPARAIVNRMMRELGPVTSIAPAFPNAAMMAAPLRAAAEKIGSADFSPLWCGQNASLCREMPAAAVTRELMSNVEPL